MQAFDARKGKILHQVFTCDSKLKGPKTNKMDKISEIEITVEICYMGLIMVTGEVLAMKTNANPCKMPKRCCKMAICL